MHPENHAFARYCDRLHYIVPPQYSFLFLTYIVEWPQFRHPLARQLCTLYYFCHVHLLACTGNKDDDVIGFLLSCFYFCCLCALLLIVASLHDHPTSETCCSNQCRALPSSLPFALTPKVVISKKCVVVRCSIKTFSCYLLLECFTPGVSSWFLPMGKARRRAHQQLRPSRHNQVRSKQIWLIHVTQ